MGQQVVELNAISREFCDSTSLSNKSSQHVYSKDFLLSVADLEHCRKKPPGIDPAVLRDTDLIDGGIAIPAVSSLGLIHRDRESDGISESPRVVPEWRRPSSVSSSSHLQQGPRRSEIPGNRSNSRSGSTWGDNGLARNNVESFGGPGSTAQGRWEPRSGPGERDRERNRPHREWHLPESGGLSLARPGWVGQEHDGLLGSGGPVHSAGLMSNHTHPLDRHHTSGRIGRTGEQSHLARVGKVSSNSHREDSDSINDQTFGSVECSNAERSEQERQRRESFEQMRKEHQRRHKEQFASGTLKHKEVSQSDSRSIPDGKHDDIFVWDGGQQNNDVLLSSSPGTPHSSSSRDDTLKPHSRSVVGTAVSLPTTPRLLIPPGFSKAALKNSSSKKERDHESKVSMEDASGHIVKQMDVVEAIGYNQGDIISTIMVDKDHLSDREDDKWSCIHSRTSKFSPWFPAEEDNPQQMVLMTSNSAGTMGSLLNSEDSGSFSSRLGDHNTGGSFQASGLTGNCPELIHLLSKSEGLSMPLNPLFGMSEAGRVSKGITPNDSSCHPSILAASSHGFGLPMPVGPSLEDVEKAITATASAADSVTSVDRKELTAHQTSISSEDSSLPAGYAVSSNNCALPEFLRLHNPSSIIGPQSRVSQVCLTCEDVEQSILAEVFQHTENESTASEISLGKDKVQEKLLQTASSSEKTRTENTIEQSLVVGKCPPSETDNDASRYLISLLQKPTRVANKAELLEQFDSPLPETTAYPARQSKEADDLKGTESNCKAEEMNNLETLFGKAFVNDLRSVGEPVSQKSALDDSVYSGTVHDIVSSNRQSNRRSGLINAGFNADGSRVGNFGTRHPGTPVGNKNMDVLLASDVHNDLWSNVSATHPHIIGGRSSGIPSSSRGRSNGGSFTHDLGQSQLSSFLPHQEHTFHQSGPGAHFLPTTQMTPQGISFESMHSHQSIQDKRGHFGHHNAHALHDMAMLPHDGPIHPLQAGLFNQSSHPIQGQSGQHSGLVGGGYGRPSCFPSQFLGSAQVDFDSSNQLGAVGGAAAGLGSPLEKLIGGGSEWVLQGVPDFSPYHPVTPGRNLGHGNSGVAVGAGGPGMGSPWDLRSQRVPGFDPYPHRTSAIMPDRKLGYG